MLYLIKFLSVNNKTSNKDIYRLNMIGNKITNNENFCRFVQNELIKRLDIILTEIENLKNNYELTNKIQEIFKNMSSMGNTLKEKINDFCKNDN